VKLCTFGICSNGIFVDALVVKINTINIRGKYITGIRKAFMMG